uniref:Heme oxygenase n=1 Tax=Porphyridium purpureum TaxID=35688 RepID=W0S1S4_PORPP|nr:heme oxygenase [Porphyridium purpureum]ATJ02881.1 heme oxygenase [Porphyridium purpureum]BAO23658.1 heme oxygenase [Porphyridium purpureum]
MNNLAQELREGTTKSHSMAENVTFVKSFLSGVIDKKAYRTLVANLYFVYSAIEEEMYNNRMNPMINHIFFPELNRKESLEKDLEFYYGPNWPDQIQSSPATDIYIQRIHNIGRNQPELLIAHAYTRYLGDLSGGQILKKIAQNAMNLQGEAGTAFYNFDLIENEQVFKNTYREALNSIPVSKEATEKIVAEANIAFTLNMKIFEELNSSFLKIMTMLSLNAIKNLRDKILN